MNLKYIITLILLVVTTSPIFAQEQPDAGSFFEKDFVTGSNSQSAKTDDSKNTKPAETKKAPATDPLDAAQGVRVKAIGAIIGGESAEKHFEPLNELIALCRDRNIPIGKVYSLGGFSADSSAYEPYQIHFDVLGGSFVWSDSLPTKYANVKTAPTWILYTEKGEILLEGTRDLEQFVNARGEFIENGPNLFAASTADNASKSSEIDNKPFSNEAGANDWMPRE